MQVENEVVVSIRGNSYRVQACKDAAGEFRTRIIASNGEVIFPPEGYKNRADSISNLRLVGDILMVTDLEEL